MWSFKRCVSVGEVLARLATKVNGRLTLVARRYSFSESVKRGIYNPFG